MLYRTKDTGRNWANRHLFHNNRSLATYKANGGKNMEGISGWYIKKDGWRSVLDDLIDYDIRAPFIFDLPVCTWGDAVKTSVKYRDGDRPHHFPCPLRIGEGEL